MITVNIKMNGYDYTMKKGITILDASFETCLLYTSDAADD